MPRPPMATAAAPPRRATMPRPPTTWSMPTSRKSTTRTATSPRDDDTERRDDRRPRPFAPSHHGRTGGVRARPPRKVKIHGDTWLRRRTRGRARGLQGRQERKSVGKGERAAVGG